MPQKKPAPVGRNTALTDAVVGGATRAFVDEQKEQLAHFRNACGCLDLFLGEFVNVRIPGMVCCGVLVLAYLVNCGLCCAARCCRAGTREFEKTRQLTRAMTGSRKNLGKASADARSMQSV